MTQKQPFLGVFRDFIPPLKRGQNRGYFKILGSPKKGGSKIETKHRPRAWMRKGSKKGPKWPKWGYFWPKVLVFGRFPIETPFFASFFPKKTQAVLLDGIRTPKKRCFSGPLIFYKGVFWGGPKPPFSAIFKNFVIFPNLQTIFMIL